MKKNILALVFLFGAGCLQAQTIGLNFGIEKDGMFFNPDPYWKLSQHDQAGIYFQKKIYKRFGFTVDADFSTRSFHQGVMMCCFGDCPYSLKWKSDFLDIRFMPSFSFFPERWHATLAGYLGYATQFCLYDEVDYFYEDGKTETIRNENLYSIGYEIIGSEVGYHLCPKLNLNLGCMAQSLNLYSNPFTYLRMGYNFNTRKTRVKKIIQAPAGSF